MAKGDLIELYVQCYYCPNLYELSDIIGCLTDTGTWRYFKIVRTGPNILRIKWTHLIKHTEGELTSSEIMQNWNFLLTMLQPPPQEGVGLIH